MIVSGKQWFRANLLKYALFNDERSHDIEPHSLRNNYYPVHSDLGLGSLSKSLAALSASATISANS